jgi:hypothetical protein
VPHPGHGVDRSWQTASPTCLVHFCNPTNCWIAAGQMRHCPFLHHYLQAKLRHHQAKQRQPIFSGRCAKTSHETDHSTLFALPALHDSPTALYEQDQRMRSIIPDLRNLSYTRRLNPSLCAPSPSTRWSVTPHECQRQLPFAAHRYSKRAVWSLMTCMEYTVTVAQSSPSYRA